MAAFSALLEVDDKTCAKVNAADVISDEPGYVAGENSQLLEIMPGNRRQ